MVMPEIGFDEEPMMPTMRRETVTKKKPKTMTSSADQQLAEDGVARDEGQGRQHHHQPEAAGDDGDEGEVALGALGRRGAAVLSERERIESRSDEKMVGSVLSSVMKPPAATAPAPIWRT